MAVTPIAIWSFSAGTGPTIAADVGSPDLQSFGNAGGWYGNVDGLGEGYRVQYNSAPNATGSALITGVNGATKLITCFVFRTGSSVPGNGQVLFSINADENADAQRRWTCYYNGGEIRLVFNTTEVLSGTTGTTLSANTLYRLWVVCDTDNATASQRFRMYFNGSAVSASVTTVTQGTAISITTAYDELVCGAPFGAGTVSTAGYSHHLGFWSFDSTADLDLILEADALLADNNDLVDPFALLGGDEEIEIDTGLAAEADSAHAADLEKELAVGISAEDSSALGPTLARLLAAGAAVESDTASPRSLTKQATPGVAAESDAALARSLATPLQTALAPEVDAAQAPALHRSVTAGVATAENDTAPPAAIEKRAATGLAAETDTAAAPVLARHLATGTASETDTARSVAFALSVSAAVETDEAQALSLGFSVDAAAESDSAHALAVAHQIATGLATESSAASAVSLTKRRAPGVATETDQAFSLFRGVPEGYPTATSWTEGARPTAATWARAEAPSVSSWSRGLAA